MSTFVTSPSQSFTSFSQSNLMVDQQKKPSIIYKDEQMYVSLSLVYNNFMEAMRLVQQLNQQQGQSTRKQVNAAPRFPVQPKQHSNFKWTQTPSEYFAVACQAIGIGTVKPRELMKLMPRQWALDCSMIGSHLQKYRIQIRKDYELLGTEPIRNDMAPFKYKDCQLVSEIVERWADPMFMGYSESEVQTFLRYFDVAVAQHIP